MKVFLAAVLMLMLLSLTEAKYKNRYDDADEVHDWSDKEANKEKRGADGLPEDIPADVRQKLLAQRPPMGGNKADAGNNMGPGPSPSGQPQKGFSTQMGGPCNFTCPNGKPTPKPNHVPKFDGCGITGMPVQGLDYNDPKFDFRQCCNVHDKCYGKCNRLKSHCDDRFKECMKKWCSAMYGPDERGMNGDKEMTEKCNKRAELIHTTTSLMGCNMYMEGQQSACNCGGADEIEEDDDDDNTEHIEL